MSILVPARTPLKELPKASESARAIVAKFIGHDTAGTSHTTALGVVTITIQPSRALVFSFQSGGILVYETAGGGSKFTWTTSAKNQVNLRALLHEINTKLVADSVLKKLDRPPQVVRSAGWLRRSTH